MFRKKSVVIIVFVCIISILACNMSSLPAVNATNPEPAVATAAIQTQVAMIVAATSATETVAAVSIAETQAAIPTNTPEFTFTPSFTSTPSFTPTPTFTFTPSIPTVSVSTNTNCRTGPGDSYAIVGLLEVGKTAEVVGRTYDGGSWIIRLPSNPTIVCWLWSGYATVSGNWKALPVVTPPPTPTPTASFSTSYVEMIVCSGEYAFTFKISNPGNITWESVKISVTDTDKGVTKTHTRDSFKRWSGCTSGSEDQNLEPGETGYATTVLPGQFTYKPTGHAMKATITVCSKDGLAGTCLSKTVSFTP